MSEEEFASMETPAKWAHIKLTMDYIVRMDSIYSTRVRLNPHHADKDKKQEVRNLRIDQYQRWSHIKNLYATHRDELADTLGEPSYEDAKANLERFFTMELDDALREIINCDPETN